MKIRKILLPLLMLLPIFLSGCDYALLAPKGPVGEHIRTTLFVTVGAMLLVVIPTLWMIIAFAIKYRHKNHKTDDEYLPDWDHSKKVEIFAWGVPIVIIIVLAIITYIATHQLDPRKRLSDEQPMVVSVVALNWKWLFIYPEEKIATVNELVIPVNQAIEFRVTSNDTMNSFFIPRLGSQIYAMAGMENRLNLMATQTGVFQGVSSNYSGYGFAGMHFEAHSVERQDYDQWVKKVRAQGAPLSPSTFGNLLKDSRNNPVTYYSEADPNLYGHIISQFKGVLRND